ncbi:MAG: hypothetical protein Q7S20_13050 [Gemmatimonadaceae bacterium]|nr:hypothetical protein [Gemmatimonadaceae bacterium]
MEQLLDQCVAENGGRLVGDPSITFDGASTRLEVDKHEWWDALMRIRFTQFVLVGANRIIAASAANTDASFEDMQGSS